MTWIVDAMLIVCLIGIPVCVIIEEIRNGR